MTLEKERVYLLAKSRGLQRMLNECCTGRTIHDISQVRQVLTSWEGLLDPEQKGHVLTDKELAKILGEMPKIELLTKKYYNHWLNTR